MKKLNLYYLSIILFFILIPLLGALIEFAFFKSDLTGLAVLLKWFVFSGIGLRLFTAGLKQTLSPAFTAKDIFNITDEKVFPIIRELGFTNICFGILGIFSLFFPLFRLPATIAGGLYFGLAGTLHLFKKKDSKNEIFAMVSDFFIFFVLLILTLITSFA